MGIRNDISCAVAHMEKSAKFGVSDVAPFLGIKNPAGPIGSYLLGKMWDSVNPTATPESRARAQATAMHLGRGAMKGIKEAIPGTLDFLGGNAAGLGRSVFAPMINHSLSIDDPTGVDELPFRDRWNEGRRTWREYVTDPIRRAEMGLGGNKVRDFVNRGIQDVEAVAGGHDDLDDVREGIAEVGTDLVVSWPMLGKSVQAMFKAPQALGKGLAAIPKVGPVASKIPSAAVGYQTMGGPEAVDALKRGWQWFTGRGYDANPQLAEYRDQNINKVKDLARWYIDNGYRQEFEDLMSSEGGGQLSEKDKKDLFGSADERFNGGRSQ